ncbi:unnamed protein product, partial [Ectocarpus sp. 12 AP-2014]
MVAGRVFCRRCKSESISVRSGRYSRHQKLSQRSPRHRAPTTSFLLYGQLYNSFATGRRADTTCVEQMFNDVGTEEIVHVSGIMSSIQLSPGNVWTMQTKINLTVIDRS